MYRSPSDEKKNGVDYKHCQIYNLFVKCLGMKE